MQLCHIVSVVPVKVPPEFIWLIALLVAAIVVKEWLSSIFRTRAGRIFRNPKARGMFQKCEFDKCESLLTPGEEAFLPALEQAIENKYRVALKVRVGDLVKIREKRIALRHASKINEMHVDFVLCNLFPVKPILVIELDDASHMRQDRRNRDRFLNDCLESAKLPILHVRCQRAYDVSQIAADIASQIRCYESPST